MFTHKRFTHLRSTHLGSIGKSTKFLSLAALLFFTANVAGAGSPAPVPFGTYYSESSMLAPLKQSQRPTTDGRVYMGNLNATIDSLQVAIEKRPPDLLSLQLSRNLYHRFRITGRMNDLEQARKLAEQATLVIPESAEAWLLAAKLQASYHEFGSARKSLDMAEEKGALAEKIAVVSYEIEQALQGGLKLKDLSALPEPQDLAEFVQRANDAINRGDLKMADELLTQAQYRYNDSNPFPIAWLHVQQGIAFLRFGDPQRASKFFIAARERLPSYYLATEHLAESELLLGNAQQAAELYQSVYEQTGNPEFLGGLAQAQAQLDIADAKDNLQRAKRDYEALAEQHPAMYSQHAAKFFLKQGDAARALKLAEGNLEVRQDIQSLILYASAAAEVGNTQSACNSLQRSLESGARPPELVELQSDLGAACEASKLASRY